MGMMSFQRLPPAFATLHIYPIGLLWIQPADYEDDLELIAESDLTCLVRQQQASTIQSSIQRV